MLGPVAIGVGQEFIGDAAELLAQHAGDDRGVELGAVAHDRLHGVDVMGDQLRRHGAEIRRVLDDTAQALRGSGEMEVMQQPSLLEKARSSI